MYFSSEEYEINDEEGRFVCSLVFIVKNISDEQKFFVVRLELLNFY